MNVFFLLSTSILFAASMSAQQNSGIGTETPGSKLEIRADGTDATKSALNVTDNSLSPIGKSLFFVRNDGNLGIGTTQPTYQLSFGGNSAKTLWMERNTVAGGAGNNLSLQAGGAASGATNATGGNLYLSSGVSTGSAGSKILFQTATPGTAGTNDVAVSTKMVITPEGRVGLGLNNETPMAAFDVVAPSVPTSENVFNFTVADARWQANGNTGDYVTINNGSNVDGRFAPYFTAKYSYTDNPCLIMLAQTEPANDAAGNNTPFLKFDVRLNNSGAVTAAVNRPLFQWTNAGNRYMTLWANGNLGVGPGPYNYIPKSNLDVNGSVGFKVVSKNATYTAANESVILVDATASTVTINLSAASTVTGRMYVIKKTLGSNAVTITPNGTEKIDGASSYQLTANYSQVMIISDGTAWFVISN